MKFTTIALASALALSSVAANAADKVTLQLKWVTQAQFAGYYVAADKGFYEEEGLDVEIKPGGPDIAPAQVLAGGGADVVIDWMPSALATREKGVPMVNIAQPFKSSGMMLTCRKDTGITSPADFPGKTLGVWFFGNEYPFLSWMSKLGIPADHLQIRGSGRLHAGRRHLCPRRFAQRRRVSGQNGPLRSCEHEGLEIRRIQPG